MRLIRKLELFGLVGVLSWYEEEDNMDQMLTRIADSMVDRVTGPMKFRIILQPLMATFFAVRSGLADAKAGRPPYFWTMLSHPEEREAMLKDGWKSIGRIFILAVVLDIVYQIYVQHFVYPGEVVIVAFLLAIVPYLIVRGLVTRVARREEKGMPKIAPRVKKEIG
jgi:hypothetical protein